MAHNFCGTLSIFGQPNACRLPCSPYWPANNEGDRNCASTQVAYRALVSSLLYHYSIEAKSYRLYRKAARRIGIASRSLFNMSTKLQPTHFSIDFAIRPNVLAFPKLVLPTSDEVQARPTISLDSNENSAGSCLVPRTTLPKSEQSVINLRNLNRYPSASQKALKQCVMQWRKLESKTSVVASWVKASLPSVYSRHRASVLGLWRLGYSRPHYQGNVYSIPGQNPHCPADF